MATDPRRTPKNVRVRVRRSMPSKLSATLRDYTTFALVEVARTLQRELGRIAGDHYLNACEAAALLVAAEEGPLAISTLAERTGAGRPLTSRAVDALAELGFVARSGSADGRRSVSVVVTESGREVAGAIALALREAEAEMFAEIKPSAIKTLRTILEELLPRRMSPIAQLLEHL